MWNEYSRGFQRNTWVNETNVKVKQEVDLINSNSGEINKRAAIDDRLNEIPQFLQKTWHQVQNSHEELNCFQKGRTKTHSKHSQRVIQIR